MQVETQAVAPSAAKKVELDPTYVKIRDIIYESSGIYHSDEKIYLLSAACQRRMNNVKCEDARQYLVTISNPATRVIEMRELLNEITIGETCLFRSQPQLNALKKIILPELIAARTQFGIKKLRIWSAGCSTGEEPYTLAMTMLELSPTLIPKGWTIEISATDLNDRSVETAKAGIYGSYALRNTTDLYKQKYFVRVDEEKLQVKPEVKSLISFSRLNLREDSRMLFMRGLDLIFCCNVLIYFDVASKKKVVQHFFSALQSPGYFFLGGSESLYQVSDQFHLVHLPGATGYLKPLPGTGAKP